MLVFLEGMNKRRRMVGRAAIIIALVTVAGCNGQQFSTTQKATGVGALLGAGSGAIVGSADQPATWVTL